jgi:hypothetical protein
MNFTHLVGAPSGRCCQEADKLAAAMEAGQVADVHTLFGEGGFDDGKGVDQRAVGIEDDQPVAIGERGHASRLPMKR